MTRRKAKLVGWIPWILLGLIIFFSRDAFFDFLDKYQNFDKYQEVYDQALLEHYMFTQDRYIRRNISEPDSETELSQGTLKTQTFVGTDMQVTATEFYFDNGDVFRHTTIPYNEKLQKFDLYKMLVHYEHEGARASYYDAEKGEWVRDQKLRGGSSFNTTTLFIEFNDGFTVVMDQPYGYSEVEDGIMEFDEEYTNHIYANPTSNGWDFIVGFPNMEGVTMEFWTLESEEALFDLDDETVTAEGETQADFWARCSYGDNHRFILDGYYSKMPEGYTPYEDDYYWRNPGIHVPYNFVTRDVCRASDELGFIQLYYSSLPITEKGYYKTNPQSSWLYDTYDMEYGYYDTRFNMDMGVALLKGYEKYGEPLFLETAKKQLAFYKEFATANHYSFYNELSEEGWLVQDYWHENDEYTPVHCALNHQIQEMYFLYLMGDITGDTSCIAMADKLLKGVEVTCDIWIKPDGDLHYGYIADGTFDREDYPDLTYNDMYNVQQELVKLGRNKNASLTKLMEAKKAYMDKNGITSYFQ